MYSNEEAKRQKVVKGVDSNQYVNSPFFQSYPTCTKCCEIVSSGVIHVCTLHGNLHVCTRETCQFIINKEDEHKQVCTLTGREYIREFENVYGYDEADEDCVDVDYVMSRTYVDYDEENEGVVSAFNERLERRRRKRKRNINRYDACTTSEFIPLVVNRKEQQQRHTEEKSSYPVPEEDGNTPSTVSSGAAEDKENEVVVEDNALNPFPKRTNRRKKKKLCHMSVYERTRELSNDYHLIKDAISKFSIRSQHEEVVCKYIFNSWVLVNKKEADQYKNKSTFYTLDMHISVVLKFIQDGLGTYIRKIPDLYTVNNDSHPHLLTSIEICDKLRINSKPYTTCCTIFRNVLKYCLAGSDLLRL